MYASIDAGPYQSKLPEDLYGTLISKCTFHCGCKLRIKSVLSLPRGLSAGYDWLESLIWQGL